MLLFSAFCCPSATPHSSTRTAATLRQDWVKRRTKELILSPLALRIYWNCVECIIHRDSPNWPPRRCTIPLFLEEGNCGAATKHKGQRLSRSGRGRKQE